MRIYYLLFALLAGSGCAFSQNTIGGKVTSTQSAPLDGAHIHIEQLHGTTRPDGTYELTGIGTGRHRIIISYVGYKSLDTVVNVSGNMRLDARLRAEATQLDGVVLEDNATQRALKTSSASQENVDGSFIRQNMGGSLMQSLERLGGINTVAIGSGQSKPIIRGLGFNRVVVAESGIKHEGQQWGADHGLEIDQYAAGNVKIVKGPASLAYGSDAIGGVIEVEKPKPPVMQSLGGSVDLTGKTNNNLYGSSFNLYGRSSRLFFDTRITSIDYADYKVPVDHINIYSYRAPLYKNRLRNTAGNELNLHFTAGYLDEKFSSVFYISNLHTQSGLFANAHGLEPRNVDTALHDASDRDIQNPSQDVNHLKIINRTTIYTGSHKLDFDAGYQRNYRQEFSDYISHGFMPSNYPQDLGIPETLEREFDKTVFSFNAKDQIMLGAHDLTLGLTAEHQNNKIGGWAFIIPKYRQTSAGVFAYDKVILSEKLLLHLGVRYDYGNIKTQDYFDWFTTPLNDIPQYLQRAQALNRTFNSPSWGVGLNYNLKNLFLRVNAGQSFRMPIAKELASNGVNYHQFSYEMGNPGLSAEKSYQLDLGATWNKDGLMVDISPFVNYFPNYIYLNPTPEYDYAYGAGNQVFRYTEAEVLRYGGEIKADYIITDNYKIGIIGEYVYSEQTSGQKKGFTLPFSPPASVLFNFTYNNSFRGFKNVYASADFKVVAAQNLIVPPENKTPGYNVLNLSAGGDVMIAGQPVTLNFQVQNAANSVNLNHTSFYRILGVPEPGRNFILSVKLPFQFNK